MGLRVKKLKGFPTDLLVQQTLTGRNGEVIKTELSERNNKRTVEIADRHYKNAGTVVKRVFQTGIGDPTQTKSHIIRATDGEGDGVRHKTGTWPALSKKYLKRKPRSRRFWRKKGKLSQEIADELPARLRKVRISSQQYKQQKIRRRRFTESSILSFEEPKSRVLTRLFLRSLVQGDDAHARGYYPFNIEPDSVDRLIYPHAKPLLGGSYQGRPWLAGLSARLGKRMHRAIRRL